MVQMMDKSWIRLDTYLLLLLLLVSSSILLSSLEHRTITMYDEALYSNHDYNLLTTDESLILPDNKEMAKLYYLKFPLKSVMKYPVLKAFGFTPFALRIWDALFAILTIILIFLTGRFLCDRYTGALAAFIIPTTVAIHENWATYNQYDSGFVLGGVAYLYFVMRYFNKKWGWLLIGFSLGFTIYFKHVQALIVIGIAGLYLIVNNRYKDIFTARFIGSTIFGFLTVLPWAIAFESRHPDFFSTFITGEWTNRVMVGYFSGGRDYLYYLKSLSLFGIWSWIIPVALVFVLAIAIKKKNRNLIFISLWFVVPVILLTIARSKLERYAYITYPAIALIIAYFIVNIYQTVKDNKKTRFLKAVFITVLALFMGTAFFLSFNYHAQEKHETYRILSDYFRNNQDGTILLHKLDKRDFLWPEFLHLVPVGNKKNLKSNLREAIISINTDDLLITTRKRFIKMVKTKGDNGIKIDHYEWFAYSPPYNFITTPAKVKVGIIRKHSRLEDILTENNIQKFPMVSPDELASRLNPDEPGFIQNVSNLILGYSMHEKVKTYYKGLLKNGELDNAEFIRILTQHAILHDEHYHLFRRQVGINAGMNIDHPYRKLYRKKMLEDVTVLGLNRGNFSEMVRGDLLPVMKKWNYIDCDIIDMEIQAAGIFKRLHKNQAVIVRESLLQKIQNSTLIDLSQFHIQPFINQDVRMRYSNNIPQKVLITRMPAK